jgi:hypothetical protein
VDGRDDRAIERALVVEPALTLVTLSGRENPIKFFSESFAHFVGGPIGKGDSDDLID